MKKYVKTAIFCALLAGMPVLAGAQRYENGLIDKSIAVVGNELIMLSDLENEVMMMRAQGLSSDRNMRCEILENMLTAKLLLMQARLDSLVVNSDMVEGELNNRLDQVRTSLGGDDVVEEYFGKPLYRLRAEWRQAMEDNNLTVLEQQEIVSKVPELTPQDVEEYLKDKDPEDLPVVPIKYRLSQICLYPDRATAATVVKERLLGIRERIINGEKFATLARLYSQDPGSARRGGELGMASKSIFWPEFADCAMSLKPGVVSQIVETPDGFHIIEVLEKKGDMFNARHILLQPEYTSVDREKAFRELDSLKTEIEVNSLPFDLAARFYSQDAASRTNGGQMADPNTGSTYYEIDQLKPEDYRTIKDLEVGQISEPVESRDNEGRDGNLVYKILRVDQILPSHTATFDTDYDMLLSQAKNEKQLAAIDEFLDRKIGETYIVLDPLFKDCAFEREQWATKFRDDE